MQATISVPLPAFITFHVNFVFVLVYVLVLGVGVGLVGVSVGLSVGTLVSVASGGKPAANYSKHLHRLLKC